MNTTMLTTVILAGGLATRLRPVTETIPKALITINGEPFIDHQLRLLHQQGIRKVVLCLGYLGEMVEKHVGNGKHLGMQVGYSFDGPTLLGTGGAIKQALPMLTDSAFFVLYGDSYLTCDYASVQSHFLASQKQGLMTVFHNKGQWDTSNVEYAQGCIQVYDKKQRHPHMHHIDYGLGLFTTSAFDNVPQGLPYDLATLYQSLLQQKQLAAYEVHQRFYEVGSFAGIKELEYYLSELSLDEKESTCSS
jgi:NDP-sugar pyrophosphorylase family protein